MVTLPKMGGGAEIDDTAPNAEKVYSSQKVESIASQLSQQMTNYLPKTGTAADANKLGGVAASQYAKKTDLEGISGLPDGGAAGQVLTKQSNANQDAEWADALAGMSLELIYENPRPSDAFAAHEISINVPDGVKLLLIEVAEGKRRAYFFSVPTDEGTSCDTSLINHWASLVSSRRQEHSKAIRAIVSNFKMKK